MNKQISQEIAEQTSEFVVNLVDHIIGHDGNCKVKVHAIRHDGSMMRFRVEVQEVITRDDGVEMTAEAKDFIAVSDESWSLLGKAGITPDCLGRVFKINGGAEYKVMGWNRKARKRPVITRRLDDGNEYVWSVAAVSKYLGVDAVRRPYGSE